MFISMPANAVVGVLQTVTDDRLRPGVTDSIQDLSSHSGKLGGRPHAQRLITAQHTCTAWNVGE